MKNPEITRTYIKDDYAVVRITAIKAFSLDGPYIMVNFGNDRDYAFRFEGDKERTDAFEDLACVMKLEAE